MSFYVLTCPFLSLLVLFRPYLSFYVLTCPFMSLLVLFCPYLSFSVLPSPFMSYYYTRYEDYVKDLKKSFESFQRKFTKKR